MLLCILALLLLKCHFKCIGLEVAKAMFTLSSQPMQHNLPIMMSERFNIKAEIQKQRLAVDPDVLQKAIRMSVDCVQGSLCGCRAPRIVR